MRRFRFERSVCWVLLSGNAGVNALATDATDVGDVALDVGSAALGNPLPAIAQIFSAFTPGTPVTGGVSNNGTVAPTVVPGGLFGIGGKTIPGVLGPAPEAVYAPTAPAQPLAAGAFAAPQAQTDPTLPAQQAPIQGQAAATEAAPTTAQTPPQYSTAAPSVVQPPASVPPPSVAGDVQGQQPVGDTAQMQPTQTEGSGSPLLSGAAEYNEPEAQPDWMEQLQQVLPALQQKVGNFFNSIDPLAAFEGATQPQPAEAAQQGKPFNPLDYAGPQTQPTGPAGPTGAANPAAAAASNPIPAPAHPTAVPARAQVPAPPRDSTPAPQAGVPTEAALLAARTPQVAPPIPGSAAAKAAQPTLTAQTPTLAPLQPAGATNLGAVNPDKAPTIGDAKKAANNAAAIDENKKLAQIFDAARMAAPSSDSVAKIQNLAQQITQTQFSNINDFQRMIDNGLANIQQDEQDITNLYNKSWYDPRPSLGGHSREGREAFILGEIANLNARRGRLASDQPNAREWDRALDAEVKTDANGHMVMNKFGNPEIGKYEPTEEMKGPLNKLRYALGHAEPSKKQMIREAYDKIARGRAAQGDLYKGIAAELGTEFTQYEALRASKDAMIENKIAQKYKMLGDFLHNNSAALQDKNKALEMPLTGMIGAMRQEAEDSMRHTNTMAQVAQALALGGKEAAQVIASGDKYVDRIEKEVEKKHELASKMIAGLHKPGVRPTEEEKEMEKDLARFIKAPPLTLQLTPDANDASGGGIQ